MKFPELTTAAYVLLGICVLLIAVFLITTGRKKK
jgi:LPXTG-motif cell wall-anchored protein